MPIHIIRYEVSYKRCGQTRWIMDKSFTVKQQAVARASYILSDAIEDWAWFDVRITRIAEYV